MILLQRSICQNNWSSEYLAKIPIIGSKYCSEGLVKGFELIGTGKYSRKLPNDLFLLSSDSCCSIDDQKKIKEILITTQEILSKKDSIEQKNLKRTFSVIKTVEEGVLVASRSNNVSNECIALGGMIRKFRLSELEVLLPNAVAKKNDFMMTIYKGFYAAICDPANQHFFDGEKDKLAVSKQFSRQFLKIIIPLIPYLYNHIPTFLNLAFKFNRSCTLDGSFNKQGLSKNIVKLNKKRMNWLESCKKGIDGEDWLKQCTKLLESLFLGRENNQFIFGDGWIDAVAILENQLEKSKTSTKPKIKPSKANFSAKETSILNKSIFNFNDKEVQKRINNLSTIHNGKGCNLYRLGQFTELNQTLVEPDYKGSDYQSKQRMDESKSIIGVDEEE